MCARILLADDNPTIRHSLRTLLSKQANWTICGEAENGKMAVEMAERLSPDLVILDLSMPVINGLDAARQIKKTSPDIQIVMFTMHEFPHLREEARKAGVNELVAKTADSSRLLNALLRDAGWLRLPVGLTPGGDVGSESFQSIERVHNRPVFFGRAAVIVGDSCNLSLISTSTAPMRSSIFDQSVSNTAAL